MQKKPYIFLMILIVVGFLGMLGVKYRYKIAAHVLKSNLILAVYAGQDKEVDLNNREVLHELAIVSTSCDKRSELWAAQFPTLLKYWPNLTQDLKFVPIYLISNFKTYSDPRIQTLAVGEDISWSDNLIWALERINKKYILLLMDDYILEKEIDEKRLVQVLNLMKATHSPHAEIVPEWDWLYDGIVHPKVSWIMYRNQVGRYRASLQAGIWDKEDLKALLKSRESAWEFEREANKRSFFMFRPFYLIIGQPLITYLNAADAGGTDDAQKSVYRGQVLDHLKTKEGIKISPRGIKISN